MAEWGSAQPRTLANAFDAPVRAHGDVLARAYESLTGYVVDVDQAYGKRTDRQLVAIRAPEELAQLGAEKGSLDQLANWAAAKVRG